MESIEIKCGTANLSGHLPIKIWSFCSTQVFNSGALRAGSIKFCGAGNKNTPKAAITNPKQHKKIGVFLETIRTG